MPTRQLIANVVELDCFGRCASLEYCASLIDGPIEGPNIDGSSAVLGGGHPTQTSDISRQPFYAFFDIRAAFPSVSHDYLFMALKASGIPDCIMNIFRALYHLNAVVDFDMLVMFYIFLAFYRGTLLARLTLFSLSTLF